MINKLAFQMKRPTMLVEGKSMPQFLRTNRALPQAVLLIGVMTMTGFAQAAVTNVAIYRGAAGCEGCSEMVRQSLAQSEMPLNISYVGENEAIKVTAQNLAGFDVYIQPGGGQDIPAAFSAIGEEGAAAIRQFVRRGNNFVGICMGAYLADKDWLGLIPSSLDSEVLREGTNIPDQGDYMVDVRWDGKTEQLYYQDGPYLNAEQSAGFQPLAYYANGDIAMAKYQYGKGTVVLSGPHPEAGETWLPGDVELGTATPQSRMTKVYSYLQLGKP